ncbi:MAG: hypothetical protein ACP5UZ_07905, partial [Thermoplasmata archaeon]
IDKPNRLCLYTKNPGSITKKYIEWGEKQNISIRGRKEPVIGYNNVPSVSGRKNWYSLNDLEPSNIILPMYVMDRFFIPVSREPVICDNTFYTLKSKVKGIESYLNSTIFYITMELYLRRLGGGVGEIKVTDYEQMPVPDLHKIDLSSANIALEREVMRYFDEVIYINFTHFLVSNYLEREVMRYFDEVKMKDRKELDSEILKLLSAESFTIEEFYKEFVELVDDRLIKADRGLKSKEATDEQDN